MLRDRVFSARHQYPEVKAMIYPTITLYNAILDHPTEFGFDEEDVTQMGSKIWYDYVHPTSAFHNHLANHVIAWLHDENAVSWS